MFSLIFPKKLLFYIYCLNRFNLIDQIDFAADPMAQLKSTFSCGFAEFGHLLEPRFDFVQDKRQRRFCFVLAPFLRICVKMQFLVEMRKTIKQLLKSVFRDRKAKTAFPNVSHRSRRRILPFSRSKTANSSEKTLKK